MARPQALITIALLAVLAAGLAYAVGVYGLILAGAAGLFLVVGVSWKTPERKLLEHSPTLEALGKAEPEAASAEPDPEPDPGARPWIWKALVAAFSVGLGVLGFVLEATLFRYTP